MLGVDTDVNQCSADGFDPLAVVTLTGNLRAVDLLLAAKGLELNTVGAVHTPLGVAAASGRADIVARLLAADGVDVNKAGAESQGTPLFAAASRGHVDVVSALLKPPAVDVNRRAPGGMTALQPPGKTDPR